jgi:hypothetical protein
MKVPEHNAVQELDMRFKLVSVGVTLPVEIDFDLENSYLK